MKFTKIFAVALAAVAMVACSKEPNGGNVERKSATIEVKVKPSTRAITGTEDGTGNEVKVSEIEIYTFNNDNTRDGYFTQSSSNTVARFTVNAAPGGENKKFLVAINQGLGNVTGDYDDIKVLVNAVAITDGTVVPTVYGTKGFAMAGEGATVIYPETVNSLTVDVARLISKIEAPTLKATTGGTVDFSDVSAEKALAWYQEIFNTTTTTFTDATWTFEGYVVINGIKQSYAYPQANFTVRDQGATGKWLNPYLVANASATDGWFKTTYTDATGATISTVYGGASTGDKFLLPSNTENVYIFENSPTRVQGTGGAATYFVNNEVSAFLIKGTFYCDEFPAGADRYWRVNMIKDDAWKVYRNSIYRTEIGKILTPGYNTPKEAEEEVVPDPDETVMEISINRLPWDVRFQGVDL